MTDFYKYCTNSRVAHANVNRVVDSLYLNPKEAGDLKQQMLELLQLTVNNSVAYAVDEISLEKGAIADDDFHPVYTWD
jgi:hypothetical protein